MPRPGLRALGQLVLSEMRMVIRDTAGLIIPFGLPILIMLTSASGASAEPLGGGFTAFDVFVLPLVLVMIAATIGVINMPSFLSMYRKTGILRRLAATPVPPTMLLAAQVLVSLAQALIGMALALGIAKLAFDFALPLDLPLALAALGLTILALYGVGMLVASVAPTPNAAVAIGLVAFFALGALGGMFGGPGSLPAPLAEIGSWLPFGAGREALTAAWIGQAVPLESWLGLGATVLVGTTVSAALFRWE